MTGKNTSLGNMEPGADSDQHVANVFWALVGVGYLAAFLGIIPLWIPFWAAIGLAFLNFALRPRAFGADIGAVLFTLKTIVDWFVGRGKSAIVALAGWINKRLMGRRSLHSAHIMEMAALPDNTAQASRGLELSPRTFIAIGALICVLALIVFIGSSPLVRAWMGPSASEIRADVRADMADAMKKAADAEARRAQDIVPIVERHAQARARAHTQTEQAREAIAAGPDLEARFAEYSSSARRLRDEAAAARAAALSDYRASLDPGGREASRDAVAR